MHRQRFWRDRVLNVSLRRRGLRRFLCGSWMREKSTGDNDGENSDGWQARRGGFTSRHQQRTNYLAHFLAPSFVRCTCRGDGAEQKAVIHVPAPRRVINERKQRDKSFRRRLGIPHLTLRNLLWFIHNNSRRL